MTDAAGRYGFAELCSGSATLQALLSNGQSSPMVNVDLTGGNQVQVDLSLAPAAAVTRTVTATPRATASAPTPVPGMPATGSSAAGWLLTGAAALGFLLLLVAGVRRVLLSHEGVAQQRQLHGWSTHDIDITLHNGGDRCDVIEY
jgi:hypothetical protein